MRHMMLSLIRFYQRYISPISPGKCRFSPTCSAYAYEAINKYGPMKGLWLALKRLSRCHPFNHDDWYDPVP